MTQVDPVDAMAKRALDLRADPGAGLGNASAYLEAFGHVAVAYVWPEQAVVAHAALASRAADEAFYRGSTDMQPGWF